MDPCGSETQKQVEVLLYTQKQDLVLVHEFSVSMAHTNIMPFYRWKNYGLIMLSQEHAVMELRGELGSGWGFSKHFAWVPQASCSEVLGPVQHTSLGPGALPKLIRGSGGGVSAIEQLHAQQMVAAASQMVFFYHVAFFFHIRNFF